MEKMTFEEKLKHLEEIVEKLEQETISLEQAVQYYAEAKKLSEELNSELNESLKKMAFVVENGEVKPYLEQLQDKEI